MTDNRNRRGRDRPSTLPCSGHWYGDLLTEEQWSEVREGVREELVEVSDAIRAVELGYDDEPFPLFAPYRGED